MRPSRIAEAEVKCTELQNVLAELNEQYNEIITWSGMYDTDSFEAKKMIINYLISRVEIYRGYKLHIDFQINLDQFNEGLDIAAQSKKLASLQKRVSFDWWRRRGSNP